MITQAFHASQDAAPEGHQNRLRLFLILFILHVKQGEVSKSDPSDDFDKRRISQPKNQL